MRRYARAIELAKDGVDPTTIAARVGLTVQQVRERLAYRERRKVSKSC